MDEIDFATMTAYQLIEHLDAAFPHQCIKQGQTAESAHRYAGQRELIDLLLSAMAAEQNARSDG